MKVLYQITKFSSTKEIYVLWKKLENSDNLGLVDVVGTTFEEVVEYIRKREMRGKKWVIK